MKKKKTNHNECYTYFHIVGDFNKDVISKILDMKPFRSWNADEVRRDGSPFGFACWSGAMCDEYDPYITIQMEKTIALIENKKEELKLIKDKYNAKFYLTVVPSVYDITPCVSPSLKVMEFCVETQTELDIDMYIYSAK